MASIVGIVVSTLGMIGCDEPLFVAPACTEAAPEGFGAFVEDDVIEVVVTAPFEGDFTRGAFAIIEPDTVSGGTLLTQTAKHDLVLTLRPAPGAAELTFRVTTLCAASGEDPSDGGRYPKYDVVIEVLAARAGGDPVRVTLTREEPPA